MVWVDAMRSPLVPGGIPVRWGIERLDYSADADRATELKTALAFTVAGARLFRGLSAAHRTARTLRSLVHSAGPMHGHGPRRFEQRKGGGHEIPVCPQQFRRPHVRTRRLRS